MTMWKSLLAIAALLLITAAALLAVAIGPAFAQDGGAPSEPGNLVQQLEDLKAQVDTNAADIATNAANIATNAAGIADLLDRISQLEALVAILGDLHRKRVFVSSVRLDGNLGGLAGADAECQFLAEEASLAGTYMAWLADSTGSPSVRFSQSAFPYVRTDGVVVADDYTDLTTCDAASPFDCLQNPITKDEFGATIPAVFADRLVWTNVFPDGSLDSGVQNCTDWTSSGFFPNFGRAGFASDTVSTWTAFRRITCVNKIRLYCFEQ